MAGGTRSGPWEAAPSTGAQWDVAADDELTPVPEPKYPQARREPWDPDEVPVGLAGEAAIDGGLVGLVAAGVLIVWWVGRRVRRRG